MNSPIAILILPTKNDTIRSSSSTQKPKMKVASLYSKESEEKVVGSRKNPWGHK